MIGRIDIEKTLRLQPNAECLFVSVATVLNHVVDAVNGILDYAPLEMAMKAEPKTPAENVQDRFAEQRKWIGKLCRFRDNPAFEWKYGILEKIYEDAEFPFWDTDCYEYAECEPVKPDDDIIYKGGDNE
jgi:hypothetical protein